jgi:peroxiredoxin Q/BCP
MSRPSLALSLPLVAALATPAVLAQSPAPQGQEAVAVGATAPDFTLPGGTRYGVLKTPVHLSDFKGKTVVLAFFYKARTKG